MTRRALQVVVVGLSVAWGLAPVAGKAAAPAAVEPAELTKRDDLIGSEIVVDDRVVFFQFHKDHGFDGLVLRRTPVVFRLPPRLRPEHAPTAPVVRARGILQRQGTQFWCDVTGFELLPSDLERLNRAVTALGADDADGRIAWARWAERRGQAFDDRVLLERARAVESEAFRIEAERPVADAAAHWLDLAQRARAHQLPEPEPSALAHRAFAALLAKTSGAADLTALSAQIAAFWPAAQSARRDPVDLSDWEARYDRKPDQAYRSAPASVRAALDHRLWALATQHAFEAAVAAEPQNALALADQAAQLLPDRPEVATALWAQALQNAIRSISSLRKADVDSLAGVCRERLRQPERARELYKLWLDDQRDHRLSPTDAEGRVALAGQYESLLGDAASAVALLRAAWKIDPDSPDVAQAFRARGFRKIKGEWAEASPSDRQPDLAAASQPSPTAAQRSNSLLHATPDEVRQRLGGKPTRIAWSATQGELTEQWIYASANQNQYVNFLHRAGDPQPKVVAFYSLPPSRAVPSR